MTTYPEIFKLLEKYNLVLASGSPRRVKILTDASLSFRQIIPDIDENRTSQTHPYRIAEELARRKAESIRDKLQPEDIALGCDTIVVLDNKILGKPQSRDQARQMLTALSGRKHVVCTAVSLLTAGDKSRTHYELTGVIFNPVTDMQIDAYIDTGEPMDKAGAYGIQGMGSFLVDSIIGNLDNVIGLPMTLIERLAGEWDKK